MLNLSVVYEPVASKIQIQVQTDLIVMWIRQWRYEWYSQLV